MASGRRNRAPRVNIPNRESAVINIGGTQITGPLCQLSINGGSLRLAKNFGENTFAEITLQTMTGSIVSPIQFLKSGAPGVQAFRFVQLDPQTRSTLETTLTQMRKDGLGEGPRSMFQVCTNVARRVMEKAKESERTRLVADVLRRDIF
jgi:hypothetical protein